MTSSEFFNKFKSKYLWGNLFAMAIVVVLLCVGVKFGIDIYTHHGEAIPIPDIRHKNFADAERILADAGLQMEQSPTPGDRVKAGRIIYVTINSGHTPTLTIPDVIDNSSLREAMAKLTAMGFKLGPPQYIPGEEDWVYGILVKGRHVVAGDKVSIDAVLTIQVGNGQRDAADSINFVEPMDAHDDFEETNECGGDDDNFEVVPGTEPTEPTPPSHSHNQNEIVE